jgi:beta-N-acetylglucosaminidase
MMLKRSTGTIVACILFFLLFFTIYSNSIFLKTNPQTILLKLYPVQTQVEGNISTLYQITLPEMANANNLSADLLDPGVLRGTSAGSYEFLDLRWVDGITASDLTGMLKGKGVLQGHEQDFWDAGRQYDINPVYLAAHARVESGNGTSNLAKGIYVQAGGYTDIYNHSYTVAASGTYYNLFGIHAFDRYADEDGSMYAASQNWNSVSAAIFGGAEWLSGNYIHPSKDADKATHDQYTLYQMRYDPYGWSVKGQGKEYATDQDWAQSIAAIIRQYANIFKNAQLQYDIPQYSDLV